MISLTFKTDNKNLVERYKDALNVYDDWKTNTKISCVGAGFGKFMGIDLMIPIFFFRSQSLGIVNVNDFVEISKVGSIMSFTEQGKYSDFYQKLSEYSQSALHAMKVKNTYGDKENHTFSHAVTYTLDAFSIAKHIGIETHSQAWLVEDELILIYPTLILDNDINYKKLAENEWCEIKSSEFKKLYMKGLLSEVRHPI